MNLSMWYLCMSNGQNSKLTKLLIVVICTKIALLCDEDFELISRFR